MNRTLSTRSLILIGSGAVAALLSACGTSKSNVAELSMPTGTSALAVDVQNFRGSVEVRVNKHAQKISIESKIGISDSKSPDRTTTPTEMLAGVDIAADVLSQGERAVLKVRTSTTHPQDEAHQVALWITVPRCDGFNISNRDGLVEVVGAAGAANVTNHAGPIEIRTDKPVTEPVTLTTTDGNIYYQVPDGSAGQFDLETLKGECALRNLVTDNDDTYYTRLSLKSRVAKGDNPVVARTNDGDIRVWVMKDPMALTRMYKKTVPDYRDYLWLEGEQRFTRNLPDETPRNTEYSRWYNLR